MVSYCSGFGKRSCVRHLKLVCSSPTRAAVAAFGCAQLSLPLQSHLMQAVCFLRQTAIHSDYVVSPWECDCVCVCTQSIKEPVILYGYISRATRASSLQICSLQSQPSRGLPEPHPPSKKKSVPLKDTCKDSFLQGTQKVTRTLNREDVGLFW